MAVTILTSREFSQHTGRAKKLARRGPVFITDHGRPAYVVLAMESYRCLTSGDMSLAEALAQPCAADFEFKPPRIGADIFEVPDLE
jgi:PHD/YefM family antitoxin component YafN of YafNO toxin-antitoxin module